VRTLHHFDEIGLLRPAARSPAGHRRYTADDVRRLSRIITLRQLGLPLREIAQVLAGDVDDLEKAVREQLGHVDQALARQRQVRWRLLALQQTIRQAQEPSVDQLIDTIEAMTQAQYFTPEQLEKARRRHEEPGFAERLRDWQTRCAHLVDKIKVEIRRGTDPAGPEAQALARQWDGTMREMSNGARHILSAIYAKIDGRGPQAAAHGILDADTWDFLKRTLAAGYGDPHR